MEATLPRQSIGPGFRRSQPTSRNIDLVPRCRLPRPREHALPSSAPRARCVYAQEGRRHGPAVGADEMRALMVDAHAVLPREIGGAFRYSTSGSASSAAHLRRPSRAGGIPLRRAVRASVRALRGSAVLRAVPGGARAPGRAARTRPLDRIDLQLERAPAASAGGTGAAPRLRLRPLLGRGAHGEARARHLRGGPAPSGGERGAVPARGRSRRARRPGRPRRRDPGRPGRPRGSSRRGRARALSGRAQPRRAPGPSRSVA